MLQIIAFCFIVFLSTTYGHNRQNFQEDANLQADLMPQELNPEFRSAPGDLSKRQIHFPEIPNLPVRPLLPSFMRIRRDASAALESPGAPPTPAASADNAIVETSSVSSIAEQVKQYSRVIACFVLVVSAAIEIVVYIIEAYQSESS